jgi:hypothetical protein
MTLFSDGSAGRGRNAPANRCENITVVFLVKTPRTLTPSVAAPAKAQRSVLKKGAGRQLHPRILRFGSRFSRHQSRSRPGPMPIASRVPTRSEPRKPPATAGHNLRRVLRYRIHAPPATRNQADVARARRATPSISAGRSVGPARADAYIAAAQPSQPHRNVPGSIRRLGRPPSCRSATSPATGCKRPPRFGVSVEKWGPQCFPPRPRYLMSVVGQSRRFWHRPTASGLPSEADIVTAGRHVSKVPIGESHTPSAHA